MVPLSHGDQAEDGELEGGEGGRRGVRERRGMRWRQESVQWEEEIGER